MSSKPSFHHLNGRRQYTPRPCPEPPHHEIIRFINDSWKSVCREMELNRSCAAERKGSGVTYYSSDMPDEQLPCPDFKPFDLDGFLEQRSLSFQATKPQSPQ